MTVERRYERSPIEFRASSKRGTVGTIVGYALKYERLSQNLGGFVETVARGAVDKSLADGLDILARYNHDDNYLLGRTASGTLRLASDSTGLPYEIDLPDTTAGRDMATLAERGDVYQSSFAFTTIEDEWGVTEQGFPLRTLKQVRLLDVAPVNTPAYLDTEAGLRSFAEHRGLSFDEVRSAAEHNKLATLLNPEPEPVTPDEARSTDEVEPEATPAVPVSLRLRFMQLEARKTR